MEHTRVTESRTLVYAACRSALDAHGSEPKPPLTGEASEIGTTYSYLKPLLETAKQAYDADEDEILIATAEELVVESLFLLARVMEMTDLYSDVRVETPLTAACFFALGSYMEQEAKKEDQWRDESFEAQYRHAHEELGEIRHNIKDDDLDALLHNSVDLVLLTGILYASIIDQYGLDFGSTR